MSAAVFHVIPRIQTPKEPMSLTNLHVLTFGGLAPVPFAALFLSSHGAKITRIDSKKSLDVLSKNVKSISINLKNKASIPIIKKIISNMDVLIDPFRPGVLEELGLGPKDLVEFKKLIYVRVTGYGNLI